MLHSFRFTYQTNAGDFLNKVHFSEFRILDFFAGLVQIDANEKAGARDEESSERVRRTRVNRPETRKIIFVKAQHASLIRHWTVAISMSVATLVRQRM